MKFLRLNLSFAGITRRNNRFASSTLMTLLISILFEISKLRLLGPFSHFFLIKIARIKKNDNFSFAVGLLLYTKHQHQLANNLFSTVHNFGNLTSKALYSICMCASFQMNLNILKRIELEGGCDSIRLFVKGLIAHNSSPQDSIDYFTQVHGSYLLEHPENVERLTLPEYVRNSINVSKPISQSLIDRSSDGLLKHLETQHVNFGALPSGVPEFILISYTSSYLFAVSDLVIGRIRKNHSHVIFLIVSISQFENASIVLAFCKNLFQKFENILWKVVVSQFDLPITSSVIRLVIARELFGVHHAKSILVLDGDTSFIKVDPVQVWEEIGRGFDIAFLQNESLCPWERISVGFMILNDAKSTREFLLQFDRYVTVHIVENRAFWMLDQTSAFLVLQEMIQSHQNHGTTGVKIVDLSSLVSLRDFIFTDKLLVDLKLRAKASNPDFVSGMTEALYLP